MLIHRSRVTLPLHLQMDRDRLCEAIVSLHRIQTYSHGNNFPLLGLPFSSLCKSLYGSFLSACHQHLGPFSISPHSSDRCWAYVSNRQDYRKGVHHHLHTATINGVYYLRVPTCSALATQTGALCFFDDNEQQTLRLQPQEDDLLIFPSALLHEPEPIESDHYRIAINMEVICDSPVQWGSGTGQTRPAA